MLYTLEESPSHQFTTSKRGSLVLLFPWMLKRYNDTQFEKDTVVNEHIEKQTKREHKKRNTQSDTNSKQMRIKRDKLLTGR